MLSISIHNHHHHESSNLIDFHPVPLLMTKVLQLFAVDLVAAAAAAAVVVAVVAAAAVAIYILKISFRNQKITVRIKKLHLYRI